MPIRQNKIENRQRATQLCQRENQFCMNEIHFCRSETQFHTKNLFLIWQKSFFGKIQFHIGEKIFHEREIEIRSRDLGFHLGKIDMEKV